MKVEEGRNVSPRGYPATTALSLLNPGIGGIACVIAAAVTGYEFTRYARPSALLALVPFAVMLAYARSPHSLECLLRTPVMADARPPALLAHVPVAVMLAFRALPLRLCFD